MKGQKLEIQLPDTPNPPDPLAVHPDVANLRERLARVETAIETKGEGPVAAEALKLAAEAHQLASRAVQQLETSTEPPAPPAVLEIAPPATPPALDPAADLGNLLPAPQEPILPWWHPSRLL